MRSVLSSTNAAHAILTVALHSPTKIALREARFEFKKSQGRPADGRPPEGTPQLRWRDYSYRELAEKGNRIANFLVDQDLSSGEAVGILASNSARWLIVEHAIRAAGGVVVPLPTDSSPEHIAFKLDECGVRKVFVEGTREIQIFQKLAQREVSVEGTEWCGPREIRYTPQHVISLQPVLPELCEVLPFRVDDFEAIVSNELISSDTPIRIFSRTQEDLASIVYTSGTTGGAAPKGAEILHRNLLHASAQVVECGIYQPPDQLGVVLSLSHIFPDSVSFAVLSHGGRIAIPSKFDRDLMRAVISQGGNHVVALVPRVLDAIWDKIEEVARGTEAVKANFVLRRALAHGMTLVEARKEGKEESWWKSPLLNFALAMTKKRAFGPNIKYVVSGGAPLSDRTVQNYASIGVTVLNGWGLTETTGAAAVNLPVSGGSRAGTVGRSLSPRTTVDTVPSHALQNVSEGDLDPQLRVSGPIVARGYYRRPKATAEAFPEPGRFLTGDLGRVTEDGFVSITGRDKNVIVCSNGKKISAELIEEHVTASPFIEYAVATNRDDAHMVVHLLLKAEAVRGWMRRESVTEEEKHARLIQLLRSEITSANQGLDDHEKIKFFTFSETEPSVANGLLTPTLKLIRSKVVQDPEISAGGVHSVFAETPIAGEKTA